MNLPEKIEIRCPGCEDVTEHEVLTGRLHDGRRQVLEAKVKCNECGRVHRVTLKTGKLLEIPLIISDMENSERQVIDIYGDETVSVGDEFDFNDNRLLITGLETGTEQRPRRAKAMDIKTIWAKMFNEVRIGFAVNRGHKTSSYEEWAVPEKEYAVDSIIEVAGKQMRIKSIKTNKSLKRKGIALAKEIVRVYCKEEREMQQQKPTFWRRSR